MNHKLLVPALLLAYLTTSQAQEINFADLRRPGRPMVKNYSVGGLASEGYSYISQYSEVDDSRVAAHNRAVSAAVSAQSQSSSSGTSQRGKTFICKIFCESGTGPVISRQITAPSRSDAARLASDEATNLCRKDGFSKSSNRSYSDSQCSEQ